MVHTNIQTAFFRGLRLPRDLPLRVGLSTLLSPGVPLRRAMRACLIASDSTAAFIVERSTTSSDISMSSILTPVSASKSARDLLLRRARARIFAILTCLRISFRSLSPPSMRARYFRISLSSFSCCAIALSRSRTAASRSLTATQKEPYPMCAESHGDNK